MAEHFVEWLTRPPVVFFTTARGFAVREPLSLHQVAGELDGQLRTPLDAGLKDLLDVLDRPDVWELVATKATA